MLETVGTLKGHTRVYFPKVKEAREALREKALEILEEYVQVVKAASAAGHYEVAAQSLQWLMEHMPEEAGEKMIETSVDKPKQIDASKGPSINIGFAIGGMPKTAALPPVEVVELDDEDV